MRKKLLYAAVVFVLFSIIANSMDGEMQRWFPITFFVGALIFLTWIIWTICIGINLLAQRKDAARQQDEYVPVVRSKWQENNNDEEVSYVTDPSGRVIKVKQYNQVKNRNRTSSRIPVIILVCLIAVFGYSQAAKEKSSPANSPIVIAPPKATSTTKAPTSPVPGISGSNAYDITVGLKNMNINPGERHSTEDGTYYWQSAWYDGSVFNSFYLGANKDYEIIYATFTMGNGDNGFLYWAATMIFDAMDTTKTTELIKSTTEKSITLGDAVWTIQPTKSVTMLRVEDVDFEDWM